MSAIPGELLVIEGQTISGIKEYEVQDSKLYKESERNMNGELQATLIGIFPKLKIRLRAGLTSAEIQAIGNLLNRGSFQATYHDPATNAKQTNTFYSNDLSWKLLDMARGLYNEVEFNLIPFRRKN